AHSPNSASRPWSTRYLVGLMIATPALLWPLWNGLATTIKAGFPVLTRARLVTIARWAVLALLLGLFVGETLFTTNDMPAIQKDSTQANTVTQKLVQMGAVHIYSGYWQCDRFIFLTQEKIICAVLEENLSRGLTRYRPYYDSVHADTHASYVFPQGSNFEKNFERKMAESGLQFQKIVVAGYVVFRPLR
ncbi:MAG TPA: hypothetical protein VFN23_08925, partial [Ktedonobacteraceae bacterium]|nr:hypothetical protein [Ktedonobacteraceae bacterium]